MRSGFSRRISTAEFCVIRQHLGAHAGVVGRTFRNWLWPTRGGHEVSLGRATRIDGETDAPVRASGDGLVIYAGRALRGEGHEVILLHADGTMSSYRGDFECAVVAGGSVERGNWIGRLVGATPSLRFELHRGGRRVSLGAADFAQRPATASSPGAA